MGRKVVLKETKKDFGSNEGNVGQRKPFTINQVKLIKEFLSQRETLIAKRDLALFSTAIDTMLRSVDILKMRVSDVVDGDGNLKDLIEIKQKKTSKTVVVEISETTQDYLGDWIEASEKGMNEPLWTGFNRSGNVLDPNKPITRMTYGTIIKGWVSEILGIDPSNYNTHSLRRTKASLVYEKTQNIEVVRQLLGQSSVAATSAYLNIGSKDALRVARQVIKL